MRIDPQRHAPRFWTKVEVGQDGICWPWRAFVHKGDGYGRFYPVHGETPERAHRVAYQLWYGTPPGELCVCHHCDNRVCCNPMHLFLGTREDNNKDRHAKGRDALNFGESHGRAKLTWEDVQHIRNHPEVSAPVFARTYGIDRTTIYRIRNGTTWLHQDNAAARARLGHAYENGESA